MKYRRKLFSRAISDFEESGELFRRAVREMVQFHAARNERYAAILRQFSFDPADGDDYLRLPFLTTSFLKKHDLNTLKGIYTAASSGTSGAKSRINCELSGLWCLLKSVIKTMNQRKLFSLRPVNYVILGYKPHKSNDAQAVRTAWLATLMAPAAARSHALEYRDGQYHLQLEKLLDDLCRFSKKSLPVRLVGFPSYSWFLMELMEEKGIQVRLPEGSKMLLGGGWKQFSGQQVDKKSFYEKAERVLGLSEDDIVEVFAAVEHPIVYCDCREHHFHVPPYSRVIIRDVHDLHPLGYNQPGLVNFITPLFKASPVVSIMTDDIGILHEPGSCSCGNRAPYFEILGRCGVGNVTTCVQKAEEELNQKEAG